MLVFKGPIATAEVLAECVKAAQTYRVSKPVARAAYASKYEVIDVAAIFICAPAVVVLSSKIPLVIEGGEISQDQREELARELERASVGKILVADDISPAVRTLSELAPDAAFLPIAQDCTECEGDTLQPIAGRMGLAECTLCGHPQDILDANIPTAQDVTEEVEAFKDRVRKSFEFGLVIFYDMGYDGVNADGSRKRFFKETGRTRDAKYFEALECYANTPNPASQLIGWNTPEEREAALAQHYIDRENQKWLEDEFNTI